MRRSPKDVLSGANPPCPKTVLGWAPTDGEGTIVEGDTMLEITSSCGSSKGLTRGLSLWGIGLVLNEAALPGKNLADARIKFAATKYDTLSSTIALASIQPTFRSSLVGVPRPPAGRSSIARNTPNAAAQLVTCDALVAANESAFFGQCQQPESQRRDSRTYRESASHDQRANPGQPGAGCVAAALSTTGAAAVQGRGARVP